MPSGGSPKNSQLDRGYEDVVIPADGQRWTGLNKYDLYSRWTIRDTDLDDLINFVPMGYSVRQVPAQGPTIATLPAAPVWMQALPLNQTTYIFALCQDGNLYQVSMSGTVTKTNGSTSLSSQCSIDCWQNTNILISDPVASKLYAWNGSAFTTALTSVTFNQIAVFSNRVWGGTNSVLAWTNFNTFNSLGGDAGAVTITDSDVLHPILNLAPFSGLLYIYSDDAIQIVGNLQDTGAPAVLIFTRNTICDTVGINTQWSVIEIGNVIYFANQYGFWALSGSTVEQISGQIDGFFQNLAASSTYSAGYTAIYNQPVILWHAKWDGDNNNTLFCRTVITESPDESLSDPGEGSQWFRCVLGQIQFITSATVNGFPTTWACDSSNAIWQVFGGTAAVTSTLQTKLWNFGSQVWQKRGMYIGIPNILTTQATATLTLLNETQTPIFSQPQQNQGMGSNFIWLGAMGANFSWTNGGNPFGWSASSQAIGTWFMWQWAIPMYFKAMGINLTITSVGAVLGGVHIEYERTTGGWNV